MDESNSAGTAEGEGAKAIAILRPATSGAVAGGSLVLPRIAYVTGFASARFLSFVHSAWLDAEEDDDLSAPVDWSRTEFRSSLEWHCQPNCFLRAHGAIGRDRNFVIFRPVASGLVAIAALGY